jgi:hypothetical protein
VYKINGCSVHDDMVLVCTCPQCDVASGENLPWVCTCGSFCRNGYRPRREGEPQSMMFTYEVPLQFKDAAVVCSITDIRVLPQE